MIRRIVSLHPEAVAEGREARIWYRVEARPSRSASPCPEGCHRRHLAGSGAMAGGRRWLQELQDFLKPGELLEQGPEAIRAGKAGHQASIDVAVALREQLAEHAFSPQQEVPCRAQGRAQDWVTSGRRVKPPQPQNRDLSGGCRLPPITSTCGPSCFRRALTCPPDHSSMFTHREIAG
jgi:hypothetical protein